VTLYPIGRVVIIPYLIYTRIMNGITEAIVHSLIDLAWRPHRLVYSYFPKEYSRNSIQVAIRRLEKKGLIQKGIREEEICIRLTELGAAEFKQKEAVRLSKPIVKLKNEKWDEKWRVVVFDIPEQNRKIRRTLRETLRRLEFYPLQRSVWVSKNNYTKELRQWVRELQLSEYIKIFETKNLG